MKILHVLNTLDTGGAEMLVLNLARRIDRGRFQVAVASLGTEGDLAPAFHRLGVATRGFGRTHGLDGKLLLSLGAYVRRERFAVVHTHNATPWLYAGLAALAFRVSLVHTEHSNLFAHQARLMKAERVLSYVTRAVIADSEKVRRHLIDEQHLPASRVVTVPNGIDVEVFSAPIDVAAKRRALGLPPPGTMVVGTVGRLVDVKDQAGLLRAFARLGSAVHLVLAGDGPLRGALETQAREAGIADRVHFLGRRDDVAEIMRTFDIFVLSSKSEGLPLTILEAMAAGLPVIATAVGGIPEVVQSGLTGELVPAGAPEALAAAIEKVLADREGAAAMGRAGAARVRAHFDLTVMTARYEQIYENVTRR
jgi:sugar transferase (PEP-CTERM/EpsH1 system associated)